MVNIESLDRVGRTAALEILTHGARSEKYPLKQFSDSTFTS